jgi:hypothetical protein
MSRQVSCPVCKEWNVAEDKYCVRCNSLLDRGEIRRIEKAKTDLPPVNINANPEWVDRLIKRVNESQNPFVRFALRSAVTLWMIYMAAVGFVLWSVAWLAG